VRGHPFAHLLRQRIFKFTFASTFLLASAGNSKRGEIYPFVTFMLIGLSMSFDSSLSLTPYYDHRSRSCA
jgi:hypothetical protein